jgi:succinate dehydrogenase hydrophobic anchor subunit
MPTLSITPRMHFARRRSGPGNFAVDALIALILVLLVVFAMIALVALFGSADPSAAVAAAADGGMLILPP